MRCDELQQLMTIYKRPKDKHIAYQLIATHVRSCPSCVHGVAVSSSQPLEMLTCEQCRASFPAYYEATHPDYPQVKLPYTTIARVALHLGSCAACRQQYATLRDLAKMEELGM
jgi:hypothetical protein